MTSMSSPTRASSSMVWRNLVTTPSVAGRKVSVKNAMRTCRVGFSRLQVRDDCLRELPGASRAAQVLGACLGAPQRRLYARLHAVGLLVVAKVVEHVLRREQGGQRVGAVLAGVLGRGAVHRLEDGDLLPYVRPRRDTQATGQPRAQVRDDVAIEVRADEHVVEVRLHDELHAHVVHDAVVYLLEVVLVILRDLEEDVAEEAVSILHDVRLV